MRNFNNILVVVDGEPNPETNLSLRKGVELTKQSNGQLTLMDVLEMPDNLDQGYDGVFSVKQLFEMFLKQRTDELQRVAHQLTEEGVPTSYRVVAGRPFIEIIRQLAGGDHDILLKVATESSSSFDGNDFHLMRKSPKPVWLIKAAEENPITGDSVPKVLAAVDLAQEEYDEGRKLNRHILELAAAISYQQHGELHLISCWTFYGESALHHNAFLKVSEVEFQQIMQTEIRQKEQIQQKLVDEFSHISPNLHLLKGDAKTTIPAFVKAYNIDTVVMGTVGRTGIPGLFIGNTSETILQNIDASVVTIKPDGFDTPVKG